jgi:sodium transport system permease protein
MGFVLAIARKEILDNLRDRRTLFSALLFGPIFGPLMFTVMIQIVIDRAVSSAEETLTIPVVGIDRAPNLETYLLSRGVAADNSREIESIDEAASAVRSGAEDVVVVLDGDFAETFGTETAGRVTVIVDRSSSADNRTVQRVLGTLRAYSEQVGALRLLARGIDPNVTRALLVDEYDVSTPAGRSALLLGVLTYFLLFATLMGGMYLAIDTTAGERERRSLEPLLTLPVRRETLLAGKVLATLAFMLLSLAMALVAYTATLPLLPLGQLGMSSGFGVLTAIQAFLVLVPFAVLGALMMTLVASFTKSYKEAQTYLGLLLIVPTLPVAIATVLDVETSQPLMWVPSMSQHLLITALLKQESIGFALAAQSVVSTLLYAILLWFITASLYKREALLG